MNANELADKLMSSLTMEYDCDEYMEQAATMLRQQQAEIEALKLQLHTTLTNRDLRTYDGKLEMNNEPVAWMHKEVTSWVSTFIHPETEPDDWLPLYIHPVDAVNISEQYVDKSKNNRHDLGIAEAIGFNKGYAAAQAKTLTDEEIIKVYEDMLGVASAKSSAIEFARAILRKAQEK
jgi:hypothetical protein